MKRLNVYNRLLNVTIATTLLRDIETTRQEYGLKNRSEFVEEVLRLGMPLFKAKMELLKNKEAEQDMQQAT